MDQQHSSSSAVDEAYISFNSMLTNSYPNDQTLNFFSDASASSSQRRKRQRTKLSDKVRSLQKMLPVNKKMDMATVLEETCKYVKYLQAQVSVLQYMPEKSSVDGDRQEVLRVMVNSPVAQNMMYSSGCCVYSLEQLVLLKDVAERKALFNHQMMMFDSTTTAPTTYYY